MYMVVGLLCAVMQVGAQEMDGMEEPLSFPDYLSKKFGPDLEVSYYGPWYLDEYDGTLRVGKQFYGIDDYNNTYTDIYNDPTYYDPTCSDNNSWYYTPVEWWRYWSAYMTFTNKSDKVIAFVFNFGFDGYSKMYAVCDGDTLNAYEQADTYDPLGVLYSQDGYKNKVKYIEPGSSITFYYDSYDLDMYPYMNPDYMNPDNMYYPGYPYPYPGYDPGMYPGMYPGGDSSYDGGHGYIFDISSWDGTNDTYKDYVVACDEEDSNSATIVKYVGDDVDVIIPSSVIRAGKEYAIKSIGMAFAANADIKSVIISDNIASIDSYAFAECLGLTSVTIPNTVTTIGSYAFAYCRNMSSVEIPNSVTTIGFSSFRNCSKLASFTISNSVDSIGSYAFYGTNVTSVFISENVSKIGYAAFPTGITNIEVAKGNRYFDSRDNCNAIINSNNDCLVLGCKNTIIPNSVTSIGKSAFYDCSGLTSITIPNSVTSIGSSAFSGCSGLTSIAIPSSVTSIGSSVFYNCKRLKSVGIPNSVTCIEASAFSGCDGLTSAAIPNSVTSIGSSAFNGCRGLKSVEIPNSVISLGSDIFSHCEGLTSVSIPNSVKSIPSNAFHYCTNLVSVEIPNSVTSIGSSAFYGCKRLASVSIPSSVKSIGSCAFEHCEGLTSITIPSSVTSIGSSAFEECSNLKNVTLLCYVKELPKNVFRDCGKLSSVTIKTRYVIPVSGDFEASWVDWLYTPTPFSSCTLYVPISALKDYKTATGWKQFGRIVSLPYQSEYSLYTKDFTACPGKQVKLSLMMENETPITNWQTDMVLPNGFTLAKGDDAVVIAEDRTSGTDISIACNTLADGTVRLLASSMSNTVYYEKYGKVATITLDVASTVREGEYFITFKNSKLADPSMQKYVIDDNISKINVKRFKVGDLDNDGSVDVADLAGVVNFILEKPMEDYIDAAADVNCDGDINGIDYVAEINQILGVTPASNAKARAVRNVSNVNISSSAVYMDAGSYQSMKIRLDAPNSDYSLMQFDLTLPEGVRIEDNGAYICGAGNMKHNLVVEQVRKNSYRIMMYSASKEKIRAEQGGVISLSLVADDTLEAGDYNVTMFGKLLVDGSGNYIKPSSSSAKLFITDPTFIETAKSASAKSDIYSLDGTLVRKSSTIDGLPKGVYVIEGKKIMVK